MNGISHVLESKDRCLNVKRRGAHFPRAFMFIHQLQLAKQKPPIPDDSATVLRRTIHDLCRQSVLTTIINCNTFGIARCGKSHTALDTQLSFLEKYRPPFCPCSRSVLNDMLFDFVLKLNFVPMVVKGNHSVAVRCQRKMFTSKEENTHIGSLNSGTRRSE